MIKSVCPNYCPSPFCLFACPAGAITVGGKGKNDNICIEMDKCNGCGICRVICMTFSSDKTLERKLPWLSARVA